jgi:predicted pyridoxine 5'-phosphate oxidase superfamily flavin-nucleotide-binding protein
MDRTMNPGRQAPFHDGELAVQRRSGVAEEAQRVGQIIQPEIPPRAAAFLAEQRMAIAASIGDDSHVWASLLTGAPGFMRTPDPRTLEIVASPFPGDALADTFRHGGPLGLLAIDPERRWRMRLNGRAAPLPMGGIAIRTEQVYANCQKYIQLRQTVAGDALPAANASISRGTRFSDDQQQSIASADTIFVASHHPQGGADASHRGGLPGFVRVLDERRLAFPDYVGNAMFNTLGNLAADPRIGLLVVDFDRGDVLQVTGTALIVWGASAVAALGIGEAERAVEVTVTEVVAMPEASSLRWRLVEYSRFNPPVARPGGM